MDKHLAKALKEIQKAQMTASILALDHAAHEAALTKTLFLLQPQAQQVFEKHLEEERSKLQSKCDELQVLLASIDGTTSSRPN